MGNCKCKNIAWFETVFGLVIFLILLFVMKEQTILMFEQTEWYRALAVSLGGLTLIGAIAIVSSFSAVWIVENIGLVVIIASIIWAIRFTIV